MPSLRDATRTPTLFSTNHSRRRGRREQCLWRASLRDATRTPTHTRDFAGDRFFISRKGSKEEESDAFGWLRLRTMEILQAMPSAGFSTRRYANAYAFFNEPQRHRGHRARRERCLRLASLRDATRTPTHAEDFTGDAFSTRRYANGGLLYETLRERLRSF
ncbi:MAG: hypothetical protein V7K97_04735 [Nostoc sp.]|uniref:hypothetical protein n=1 Tax=Nostoc sp. TaxID=1180 RepID=UPI002FF8BFA2